MFVTARARELTARARTTNVWLCRDASDRIVQQTSAPRTVPPETWTSPAGNRSQTETLRTAVVDRLVTRIANATVAPD